MAFVKGLFQLSGSILVAFLAVLVYFHVQCLQLETSEPAKATRKFDPFKPDQTDCTAELGFSQKGDELFVEIGIEYMLAQWAPCAGMVANTGFFLANCNKKVTNQALCRSYFPSNKTRFFKEI